MTTALQAVSREYRSICAYKMGVNFCFKFLFWPGIKNALRTMGKTGKFQIFHAGLTNLCQHSTTDLARGIMTNELCCRRYDLSNSLKLQAAFFVFNLSPTSR